MSKRWMAALVTLLVALVLSAGVSAGEMSLTVWPLSGMGLNAVMFAEATPMSTEVGFRVTDRLELVAGCDLYFDSGDDTMTVLNLGGRYYLSEEGKARPFLFGSVGSWDNEDIEPLTLLRGGAGFASPVSEDVDLLAQAGVLRGSDSDYWWTQTFSAIGLRFSF